MAPDTRLYAHDVGKELGLKAPTVLRYLRASHGAGRYAGHPFPAPAGYVSRKAYWTLEQVSDLRAWCQQRRGRGVGGGRKARKREDAMT